MPDGAFLIAAIAFIVAALLSAVAAALQAAMRTRHLPAEARRPTTLEDRLSDLGDLMRSSARVLEEVQAEIEARIALAERAKADAQDAEQLAQLNEAQRLALARLVRAEVSTEVSKDSRRSFWQSFAVNLIFFVLGGVASVLITLWLGG
jgi:hypothetical protein